MGKIGVATKALIIQNKRVLILQRSNYSGIDNNKWEFPGGGLKFGEELAVGLMREIREEAGINVNVKKLLYAISRIINPQKQIVGLTYLCDTDTDKIVLSDEHIDYLWATKSELKKSLNQPMLDDLIANSVFDMIDIQE